MLQPQLMISRRKAGQNRQGFSLPELAMVLAVAAVIFGLLWAAVDRAWDYTRQQQAMGAIRDTVTNAQNYFAGHAVVPATDYRSLTSQWIAGGLIPASTVRGGSGCSNPGNLCADSPWGPKAGGAIDSAGTMRVCNWPWDSGAAGCANGAGTTSVFFGVSYTGLSIRDCISLVENISGPGGPAGLMEININANNMLALGSIQPVGNAAATTTCGAQPNGSASVVFVYRMLATPR